MRKGDPKVNPLATILGFGTPTPPQIRERPSEKENRVAALPQLTTLGHSQQFPAGSWSEKLHGTVSRKKPKKEPKVKGEKRQTV